MRLPTSSSGRHLALIVLVAALVALAGCSGDDGGNGTTDPADTTDAPVEDMETTEDGGMSGEEMTTDDGMASEQTTTEDEMSGAPTTTEQPTPIPTQTAEPTTTDTGDDGTDDSDSNTGDLDSSAVIGSHTERLRNAGSFTAVANITSITPNGNTTANVTIMVDLNAGEGYQQINFSADLFSGSTITYTSGNETFQRTASAISQQPQYSYESAPYSGTVQPVNVSTAGTSSFLPQSAGVSWTEAGGATVNGFATTQYTASGTEAISNPGAIAGSQVSSVDTIELNAFVDGDGVIRRMTVDFTGESQNGGTVKQSLVYEITDIGSTTVPTPGWLEEARNSSN